LKVQRFDVDLKKSGNAFSAFPLSQMRPDQVAKKLFLFSARRCAGFGAFRAALFV
jgi:hypothetical protein